MAAGPKLDQGISLMRDSLNTNNAKLTRLEIPKEESIQTFNIGTSLKAGIYCLLKSDVQI